MTTSGETMPVDFQAKLISMLVAKSTPDELRTLMADGAIDKSLAEVSAESARTHPAVWDQWRGQFTEKVNTDDVKIGPEQAASGGNAYRMAQHYSDNVTQRGLVKLAEDLGAALTRMDTMVKAIDKLDKENTLFKAVMLRVIDDNAAVNKAIEGMKAPPTKVVAKADDEKDDDEKKKKDDEEDEKAAAMCELAESVFKASLADGNLAKAIRALAMAKSVSTEFPKAPRATKLVKNIQAFADILAKSEEEDDDSKKKKKDEEDEKAASKARMTESMSALSPEQQSMLQKAVDGQGVLTMKVDQLFDIIGKSVPKGAGSPPPVVFKSIEGGKGGFIEKAAAITDHIDEGRWNEDDANMARGILSLSKAVTEGKMPQEVYDQRVRLAPKHIQDFFTATAA